MKHGADEIEEEGDDGALSPRGDGALSPGGDGATSPGGDGSQSPTNAGSLVGQLPYILLYPIPYAGSLVGRLPPHSPCGIQARSLSKA